MSQPDDHQLLAEFASAGSESAFATLVARHVNLVYSTAFRSTGNAQNAEEITQMVFIILARKAEKLSPRVVLSGWLYQTTRLTAANFMKGEFRRHRRQEEAAMQSLLNEPTTDAAWREIAPLLDEAMGRLGQTDRDALVLRYFENKTAAEIGAALRMNEKAASQRVNRALEKLRRFLLKCGVNSTTATIGESISANSIQAAPVALAKTVTAVALAKSAVAGSSSTLTLIKGALKVMAWSKAKTIVVMGVAVVLATGTTTMMVQHQHRHVALPEPQPVAAGETEFPKSSWHFAGYNSPESVFMSCMWAVNNGDTNALLASVSPAEQERLNRGRAIITAADRESYAQMTGYRIVDKQIVSDDKVVLAVETGQDPVAKFLMQRIGGEWKFAGRERK